MNLHVEKNLTCKNILKVNVGDLFVIYEENILKPKDRL